MPKFYTSVILLINQSKEICEKQFSVFGSKGGQISPLMHIPLYLNGGIPFKSLEQNILNKPFLDTPTPQVKHIKLELSIINNVRSFLSKLHLISACEYCFCFSKQCHKKNQTKKNITIRFHLSCNVSNELTNPIFRKKRIKI